MTEGQPQRQGGSFVATADLEADQAAAQAEETSKDAKSAHEDIGDGAPEQKKWPIMGKELTPDEVMEAYPKVYEQIQKKEYLLRGYATVTQTIAGQIEIRLRTLSKLARSFIIRIVDTIEEQGRSSGAFDRATELQIMLALDGMGDEDFGDLISVIKGFMEEINSSPTKATIQKVYQTFLVNPEVKKRQRAIHELGEQVFDMVVVATTALKDIVGVLLFKDAENPFVLR